MGERDEHEIEMKKKEIEEWLNNVFNVGKLISDSFIENSEVNSYIHSFCISRQNRK